MNFISSFGWLYFYSQTQGIRKYCPCSVSYCKRKWVSKLAWRTWLCLETFHNKVDQIKHAKIYVRLWTWNCKLRLNFLGKYYRFRRTVLFDFLYPFFAERETYSYKKRGRKRRIWEHEHGEKRLILDILNLYFVTYLYHFLYFSIHEW